MALTARAVYQNNETIINVKENDVSKNVFFDVAVDGIAPFAGAWIEIATSDTS